MASLDKPPKPCLDHLTAPDGCPLGDACLLLHLDPDTPRALKIKAGRARAAARAEAKAAAAAAAAAEAAAAAAAAAAADAAVAAAAPRAEVMDELKPAAVEDVYVTEVYDAIATHFSATRHTAWPLVEEYLRALPEGSIVGDIGCGNGKYMGVNKGTAMVGLDASIGLLRRAMVAQESPTQDPGVGLILADTRALPLRDGALDAAICIAVLHHMRTPAGRAAALAEMLRVVAPGGTLLVTVWAMEQDGRVFERQDTFVPWRLGKEHQDERHAGMPRDSSGAVVFYRFYHVFVAGELEALADGIDGVDVVDAQYDRDNWYAVFRKHPQV